MMCVAPIKPVRFWPWWGGEHSDYLFFGKMVEHLAPRRIGQPDARTEHGKNYVGGNADHGACRLDVFYRGGLVTGAAHYTGA